METSTHLDSNQDAYISLVKEIGALITDTKQKVIRNINADLLRTNWEIGKYIVEFEQNGAARAQYGSNLIKLLSKDLQASFGSGYSRSNLQNMRKLFLAFPKCQTLSGELSWSHYLEILKSSDSMEISFYTRQCENEHWTVRELRRQMDSMLFHRIALSKNPEDVISLAKTGQAVQRPEDLIHDPFVLEFVDLPQLPRYRENQLEQALVKDLESFLLEMGKGFAFIGNQYRMQIGARTFKVDLVFYHCVLKCYVLIDLKRGEISHEDIGQMNLYLNYFSEEVSVDDDNPPIGIVLGAYKDELLMEYALRGISNNLFAAKYQLYLPNRDDLQRRLDNLLNNQLGNSHV